MAPCITALVVTHNRKALLSQNLSTISAQLYKPNRILILDNASTDGTREMLGEEGWLDHPGVELLALPENTGGAGGFAAGLQHAIGSGAEWVWMMDDDAEPHPDALEELMRVATDPGRIYGSVAVSGDQTAWPLHTIEGQQFSNTASLPDAFQVVSLPFLGFLVSAGTVARIGYPDEGYFIAGDDHEYCLRARANGIPIVACGKSRIEHPASHHYRFGLGPLRPTCFYIQPWKRYYDVRNRIASAMRHDGTLSALGTTVPATAVRWLATMLNESDRRAQSKAYFAGVWDGLLGRSGRRHEQWGI
ncbi:glycosyltransferase [Ottowia sp.]|uniref:glycosyltransferase n=1 Tax=Ottowia sp. TaxID=1898956 RepID=UPI0026102112|nr:glycosyltransferase [Ottowia sp.]